ncbi:hypothetical protein BRADO6549 [Bradyrhizobium sp. ORS 278]|uniref:hypothetical protein n=1 Tax=Bradyrhizobium sp. (strain ORS 278) TaxID=114615 RepID=UPI0001508B22|nr:hypothetical protein [Bradyrhizobium sp. ORS 278]CAL80157.1 hypothetical protein BRADO6549 [Bradyrhizobium sp. ORS 278]
MVYKFDPVYWNGTIFHLDEATWKMSGDWDEYRPRNLPIPASCFPKTLNFDRARAPLPDMFHTARDIIVFSDRARVVIERSAPGEVEFIPVACHADRAIAAKLKLASAYFFINVLGRAQRLRWREVPTEKYPRRPDGTELFGLLQDYSRWLLRERAAGEPMIWHDTPWRDGNKEYRGQNEILIEDSLWRELNAEFPGQLNALRAGEA